MGSYENNCFGSNVYTFNENEGAGMRAVSNQLGTLCLARIQRREGTLARQLTNMTAKDTLKIIHSDKFLE